MRVLKNMVSESFVLAQCFSHHFVRIGAVFIRQPIFILYALPVFGLNVCFMHW